MKLREDGGAVEESTSRFAPTPRRRRFIVGTHDGSVDVKHSMSTSCRARFEPRHEVTPARMAPDGKIQQQRDTCGKHARSLRVSSGHPAGRSSLPVPSLPPAGARAGVPGDILSC